MYSIFDIVISDVPVTSMESNIKVPCVSLPGGGSMPRFGFGSMIHNLDDLRKVLDMSLDVGYRSIDTAYGYHNQNVIGNVIQDKLKSGKLSRGDLFVTTKVPGIFMASRELIRQCLKSCLADLQLEYVDLFLLHAPCGYQYVDAATSFPKDEFGKPLYIDCDLVETWKSMECMVDDGLARSIGVSNFNVDQLDMIVSSARIPVANHQIECHLYLQQKAMREYCSEHGITVTAFGPLGNPRRLEKNPGPLMLADPLVVEMSDKYNTTPAQILLAFLLQEGVTVIPKTANVDRLQENIQAVVLTISDDDMMRMREADRGHRFFDFLKIFSGHPAYPF